MAEFMWCMHIRKYALLFPLLFSHWLMGLVMNVYRYLFYKFFGTKDDNLYTAIKNQLDAFINTQLFNK